MLKSIKNISFYNTRTMVRCDFNVPIDEGKILDDLRLKRAVETLRHIRDTGAKTILISHLGRPDKLKDLRFKLKDYTLKPVQERLEKLLGQEVKFSRKVLGRGVKSKIAKLKPGEILLLENLRFEKGEEENKEDFARALAEMADCYIGEAFSVCHRRHASVVSLPRLLPHFVGFEMEKEIEVLSGLLEKPKRPLVVAIGGVKVETKIKVIEKFLETADEVLLGGRLANDILAVKGISVGKPWPGEKETVELIQKINLTNLKLHLPIDVLASPTPEGDVYTRVSGPGTVRSDEGVFDIGLETSKVFSSLIKKAGTVFWSGPMGVFEKEKFARGTKEIAEAITSSPDIFSVVGGGDTIRALQEFALLDKFSFVSIGGGAMLEFLAGERLPGIEALN